MNKSPDILPYQKHHRVTRCMFKTKKPTPNEVELGIREVLEYWKKQGYPEFWRVNGVKDDILEMEGVLVVINSE